MAASDEARKDAARLKAAIFNRVQIIGVDRLDYTKGIPERFHAYEKLLENYPDTHGQVRFLQIAPTSRGDVPEYVHLRHELETMAGNITGRFAQLDWTPLSHLNRAIISRHSSDIYPQHRMACAPPLSDGANMSATETIKQ